MKIGIDCRLIGQPVGVGRYVRNLVENLSRIDHENEYVLFVKTEDENNVKSEILNSKSETNSKFKIENFKTVISDVKWHSIAEQIEFPKIINLQNLDLMHFTYFSIPIFYYRPFVVTVHDLIVNAFNTGRASTLPYPLYFAKRLGYHAVMAASIYRSAKIIVPSEAVRTNILRTYKNLDGSKIQVTYEGGFEKVSSIENRASSIKGKYLLRVGNFYPHKNMGRLIAAFRNFLVDSGNKDLKLVLVGNKDFFYSGVEKEIESLNIEKSVIFVENPNDAELASLYKNAFATIIPSLAEGFSLTAVEALTSGSPVIASDIPVHREVCGDAAIFFNPIDINDIKKKIEFAVTLVDASRKELIKQGHAQGAQFSWRKMTEETLDIYNSTKR